MAEFNATPAPQPAGNYTGASQGIYADRNDALGRLFGNLAGALETGIQAADQAIIADIEEQAFMETELVRNEFGVGSATDLQFEEGTGKPRPAALSDALDHLEGLQAAYEQDGVKQSHYWARMNNAVRQLRARYPGYRKEIDAIVSGLVGTTPANALQSSLFSEWNAASGGGSGSDPYRSLVERISSSIGLPDQFFADAEAGNPWTSTELLKYESRVQRHAWESQDARNRMTEASQANTLTEEQTTANWRVETTTIVSDALSSSFTVFGKTFGEIQNVFNQMQRDAEAGQPWGEQERLGVLAALDQLMEKIYGDLHARSNESWDGNDLSLSYRGKLPGNVIEETIQQALAPLQRMRVALGAENEFPVFIGIAAMNEAVQTDRAWTVLQNEYLGLAGAVKDVLGEQSMGIILGADSTNAVAAVESLRQLDAMEAGTGRGNIAASIDRAEQYAPGHVQEVLSENLDNWERFISEFAAGRLPTEGLGNAVTYWFSQPPQTIFSKLTEASQHEYFRRVASPEVTRQLLALRAEGNEEAWVQYQEWVSGAFIHLFRRNVDTMSELVRNQDITATWDPRITGFRFHVTTPLFSYDTTLSERENGLNQAIRAIHPILNENNEETPVELFALLNTMGFDMNAPDNPSFIQAMFDALKDYVFPAPRQSNAGRPQIRPDPGLEDFM